MTDRYLDRRHFLTLAAVAGTAFMWGVASGQPDNPPVDAPAMSAAALPKEPMVIPAVPASVFIENAERFQKPDIGLKSLYLFTSDRLPIVGVCSVWDQTTNRTRQSPFKLDGAVGFQRVYPGFVPQPDGPGMRLRANSPWTGLVEELVYNGLTEVGRVTNGRIFEELYSVHLVNRPEGNDRYALVYGPGAVENNRSLSPLSHLDMDFKFDPLPPDYRGTV